MSLAAGEGGDIAIAAFGSVWMIDRSGRRIWAWEESLPAGGRLGADDVAFDSDGRLLVLASTMPAPNPADVLLSERLVLAFEPVSPRPTAEPSVRPTPTPAPTGRPSTEGACTVFGDKTAQPADIWLGEEVAVTLSLGGHCPAQASIPWPSIPRPA